jgi:hypothetical protein
MASETEFKASLKKFFVTVSCPHPDLIPNEKVMWAPIPFDARHPQPGFRYRAVIDILEVVVVSPGVPPPPQALTSTSMVGRRRGLVSHRLAQAGPHRLRLAPSVGALPLRPSGVGPLPLVPPPRQHRRARPPCLAPRWIRHYPRHAPAPIRNGGYRASIRWQASLAACRAPRWSVMLLVPFLVSRQWGAGRPLSRPLRLLGHPPRTLMAGLPLALMRWRFAPGSEMSRLSLSILQVTLSHQGRLLLRVGRALHGWTCRSSLSVWGLPRWLVRRGRHPLCLYLVSWPLLNSRSP